MIFRQRRLAGATADTTLEEPLDELPGDDSDTDGSTVNNSGTVAKWTLVSRITGFVRVASIAAVLGPTFLGNLFQTVNVLPWIVYDLAIGSLLTSILVPVLVAADRRGPAEFSDTASALLTAVIIPFAAITALLLALAPFTARLLALGLHDDAPRAEYLDVAVPLLLLTTPQVLGYGVIAFAGAVQNARGRFALPAAAPVGENVVVVATMVAFAFVYGTGTRLDDLSFGALTLLGVGSTVGVLVHLVIQWTGMRRVGAALSIRSPRHRSVRDAVVMARPASLAAVMNSVRLFLPLIVTGAVPGGTVAYQMAQNVLGVPTALGARSISTAFLPRASHLAVSQRWRAFATEYISAQSMVILIALPSAAALLATGPWLAEALAFGAMAGDEGSSLLRASLPTIAGAVVGVAIAQVAVATSFARNRSRIAAQEMAARLLITVLGLLIAWFLADGLTLLVIVGLTLSVSDLLGASISWGDPLRDIPRIVGRDAAQPSPFRTAVAATAVFLPLGFFIWFGGVSLGTAPQSTIILGIVGSLAIAAYLAIRFALSPGEMTTVVAQLRGRVAPIDRLEAT